MKSFYEFVQLLKENEQGEASNQLRTGEERRRHFGIRGTGGGRTDDSVIYNDMKIEYEGYPDGEMAVWFDDDEDLEDTYRAEGDIVHGYGNINGRWHIDIDYTIVLSDDPSKQYPPDRKIKKRVGHTGWPSTLPEKHGSGIAWLRISDIEEDMEPDY